MKTSTHTPIEILHQIADIQRMEPGKLCVIRQGEKGPFYNLQWRENGKPLCRYVPREQVEALEEHTANFRTFQKLMDQYAQQIITRTREERLGGQKKRTRAASANARRKNSNK